MLPPDNSTVPGIDAPAALAGDEGPDASLVPNSPPPQYTRGMRIKGWWRMKGEKWRMRMMEWQECRRKGNDDVEMGEISRSRSEPLSTQIGLMGPPRAHTHPEMC